MIEAVTKGIGEFRLDSRRGLKMSHPTVGSFRVFSFSILIAFLVSSLLTAQSGRGTINGLVSDISGAVVPGAEVVITEKDTGVRSTFVTTETGVFRAPYLPPGTYRVSVSLPGFKTAIADNVILLLAQTLQVDLVLEVGEIAEVITISSTGPLLEASSAEIGVNANQREVHAWPILVSDGTRQLQDFIFRAMPGTQGNGFAGSINGGQAYSHEILIDGITLGRFDLNGGSNAEFTPTMDAVSEFKLQTGALSSQYGATQTALTNFGMRSGNNDLHGTAFWLHQNRALNANSWEGNRRGYEKEPFSLHNFGASAGGPIVKDRTHFFVSYEGNRYENWTLAGDPEDLPIRDFKQGDFSALLDSAFTLDDRSGQQVTDKDGNPSFDALGRPVIFGQIYDPGTSRQLDDGTWIRDPFPNNRISPERFSSVTTRILTGGHDVPDALEHKLRYNYPAVSGCCPKLTINNFSVKIDHVLTESHKLAGSVIYNDRSRDRFGGGTPQIHIDFPGPASAGFQVQATPGHIVRLSEDWTLSAALLNHFALGYNRFMNKGGPFSWLEQVAGEVDWKEELGLQNDQDGQMFPVASFAAQQLVLGSFYDHFGVDLAGASPNGSWVVADDLSWLKGNHSLRFGFEFRHYYDNGAAEQDNGSYTFHSENTAQPGFMNQTGFSYASYLLGEVNRSTMSISRASPAERAKMWAFYVQDDWKARPSLTVNLGFRWDIPTPMWEKYGRQSSLNPFLPNPGADGFLGALDFLASKNDRWADTYYRQFAPRIGFAWSPRLNLVVRGGYGINFAPPIRDGWSAGYTAGFNGSNPVNPHQGKFWEDTAYNWDEMYPKFEYELPNTNPAQRNGSWIAWYLGADNNNWGYDISKQPYVQNWNLGVQFDAGWETRIEANYVGNKGTRLNEPIYTWSLNQADPSLLELGDTLVEQIRDHPEIPKPYPSFPDWNYVGQAFQPFPQYLYVGTQRLNNGWSSYHALQLTATKRSNFGLSFLSSYTWSKTLGTGDTAGPGVYTDYGQDFYNRKTDYGISAYHYPHDLKLTWIYDLPFGPQGNWATSGPESKILGGWQLAAIMRYRSGAPLRVTTSGYNLYAIFNPGIRPDVLLDGYDNQTVARGELDPIFGTQYLNPAAFGNPPKTNNNVPLRFGTAPRWLPHTRGFALLQEDLSLIKRTDLGFREGANLEIRFDLSNLFNRTQWSNPNINVASANFGKVLSKGGITPRTIQAGLRINW